ncbi:MAG TPA: CRTAC1 family protein [Planctomycetes bacterium]|nr:CRTAC1 family protein [Planctomycetota bacterium]
MTPFPRPIRAAVLHGALVLALVPAASPQTPENGRQRTAEEERIAAERKGHERMLAYLAKVHEERDVANSYLGTKKLLRFQKMLEQADEKTSPKTIALLQYEIGQNLLRLGHNEEAIESLLASHETLQRFDRSEWPPFAVKLEYAIAVAYMRLGETANCVGHHGKRSCILPIQGDGVHVDPFGSRNAILWYRKALSNHPGDRGLELCARWLLNVMAMTLGEWPDSLSEEERIASEYLAPPADFPNFPDVAPAAGLNRFGLSGGSIVEDLDGDGLLDVMSSSWDTQGQLRFYHNNGDGTFTERTEEAGLVGIVGGLNLSSADFDNDGDVDVLVLRGAWIFGRGGEILNSLLRNDGGRFVDVTFLSGLGEVGYPTQTASWADFDLDGDLDLYIGNEGTPNRPHPGQLFRNDDGHFVDIAKAAGVANPYYAKGVAWGDYDEDRYPDLYVSNIGAPNRLYHNNGDGTFEDIAFKAHVDWPLDSFPVWFWDFDNDGHLDIYVASYDQGTPGDGFRLAPVVASTLGEDPAGLGADFPRLFKGDGKGHFENVTKAQGMDRISLTMGANFGDLDNDGYPDCYLGTGYPFYDGLIPNVMYRNLGGTGFENVTAPGGFGELQKGHGVSFADIDGDGDEDVFEVVGGAYLGDRYTDVLFENPGFGNHWIHVRLVGKESNRFGIGSRIHVTVEHEDGEHELYHTVSTGGSFGCNPMTQNVGLGPAERIVRLEIFWPKTGKTQVFEDVPFDRELVITEGEEELEVREPRRFRLGG